MNGTQIRIIKKANELWFVVEDVANVLGFSNANQVTTSHNIWKSNKFEDVKEGTLLVSDNELFLLLIQSSQPEATQFRKWVGREALPSIRMSEKSAAPEKAKKVVDAPNKVIELAQYAKARQQPATMASRPMTTKK